jgi:16S rRNA (adenine1518-N6/adenine1519-N6)-dimethyltransferase
MPEKSMRAGTPRGRSRRQVLGRHYLASPGIRDRILEAIAPLPEDFIIEIGPGGGALTFPLASRAGRVLAVEKDPAAVAALARTPLPNLEVVEGDILSLDLAALSAGRRGGCRTVKLVGNIPYSISSPLLLKALEERASFDAAAFLVQKEVAEKIRARPGSKNYGPLSIRLQVQFEARIAFGVKPGSFVPPPKVDSAFVTLVKRPAAAVPDAVESGFGLFLRGAFKERRRTLRNNLAGSGHPAAAVDVALEALRLGRTVRAEDIPVDVFVRLFRDFSQRASHDRV